MMNSGSFHSNKLFWDEQEPLRSLDDSMNSQPFVPKDPMKDMREYQGDSADNMIAFSGFSVAHSKAPYIGTESTQNPALLGPHYTNNSIDMGSGTFYDGNRVESAALPFYCPYESSGSRRLDTSMMNCLVPKGEVASAESYMNMERHHTEHSLKQVNTYPVQGVKMEEAYESGSVFNFKTSTSNAVPRRFSKNYQRRSRASEAEYNRKTLIAEKMHMLQELLPGSNKFKKGDEEAILDNTVALLKYLQFQLKELSRCKLGGGLHTAPLSYLEGYGHYHPQDQLKREPLEKEIGSLVQQNQDTTLQLLESKGLRLIPRTSVDAIRCSL